MVLTYLCFQTSKVHFEKQYYKEEMENPVMFSKIGRYISNKILKYSKSKAKETQSSCQSYRSPKHSKKQSQSQHRPTTKFSDSTAPLAYCDLNKPMDVLRNSSDSKNTGKTFQPSVGAYKVTYNAIDKSCHTYNFNRSVPHFYNQKFHCQETIAAFKQYPDPCPPKQQGFVDLDRIAGRNQIKGSVRKVLDDPHQNRFILKENLNPFDHPKCLGFDQVSEQPRLQIGKNNSNSPEYKANYEVGKKRLNTHIIPFEKQTERKEEDFLMQKGISESFAFGKYEQTSTKSILWKKMLPREKSGLFPSYMDKTVNSRMMLNELSLKKCLMNCTDMKKPKLKQTKFKPQKPTVKYIEEEEEI